MLTRTINVAILVAAMLTIVCGAAQAREPRTVAWFVGGALAGLFLGMALAWMQVDGEE